MRAQVVNISGRARLIAKLRMILDLEYFLRADQEWTKNHLIEPLRADEDGALVLWSAIGGRRRFRGVLKNNRKRHGLNDLRMPDLIASPAVHLHSAL